MIFCNKFCIVTILIYWCVEPSASAKHHCDSLSYRIGVRVRCEHPSTGESINCRGEKVPVGAVARYRCDDYYLTLDGESIGGNMTCSENGKWVPEHPFRAYSCNIDCGRQIGDNKWPWHAAIFKRENPNTPFKYVCGGTLVNPFNKGLLILTGAKCLNSNPDSGFNLDTENVKVALGLVTGNFGKNSESPEVDVYSVKKTVTNTEGGIALMKLSKDVVLKENVLPVCFNGNPDLADELLETGSYGEFVGFGNLGAQLEYDTLRGIQLPFIGNTCYAKQEIGRKEFCAGSLEGSNICSGDNGGSISFPSLSGHAKRHFVQGVYTGLLSPHLCESYGGFTRLVDYSKWIRETAVGVYLEESSQSPEFDIAFQLGTTPAPSHNHPRYPEPKPTAPFASYNPNLNSRKTSRPSVGGVRPDIPVSPVRTPSVPSQSQGPIVSRNPKDYELMGLEWHNRFRGRHSVPSLILNYDLNTQAQLEAEDSLRQKRFYSTSGFANWFTLSGAELSQTEAVKEAVKDWYKSYAYYNPNKPVASPFTHIVWKSATEMGVGYASSGSDQIVVVKYKRPIPTEANSKKDFDENVLPASVARNN